MSEIFSPALPTTLTKFSKEQSQAISPSSSRPNSSWSSTSKPRKPRSGEEDGRWLRSRGQGDELEDEYLRSSTPAPMKFSLNGWTALILAVAILPATKPKRRRDFLSLPGALSSWPMAKDLKGSTVPGVALVPGIIAFAGGLPVMTDDKVQIGGIGVSSSCANQDETCAQAGIDAIKDALK